MNETGRGVLIFVSALITIWLWAPLSNQPSRTASGTIINETYFGPLHYLVLHTELKEPNYTMERKLNPTRLAITTLLSAGLWVAVIFKVKGKPLTPPDMTTDSHKAN